LLKKSRHNPKSIQHSLRNLAAEEEPTQKRERQASFQRKGTGRYDSNQSLQTCIANEKGLLNKDDFEHVQKVIEVYSKALLCEIRQKNQQERMELFRQQDWDSYCKLIQKQQIKEVKEFANATKEVLDVAKIKSSCYNQTVMMYLITSADCFL
jgi:hypothetical protein